MNNLNFERNKNPKEILQIDKKSLIINWLKFVNIKKYFITNSFLIDVDEQIDLSRLELTRFPEYIKFRKVLGNFYCDHNRLVTLKGCPLYVYGSFYCNDNELRSLKFGPIFVKGSYIAHKNSLSSLRYLPEKLNRFSCNDNLLETLQYLPSEINGDLYCYDNNLSSIKHLPQKINGDLYINFKKGVDFTVTQIRQNCYISGTVHII